MIIVGGFIQEMGNHMNNDLVSLSSKTYNMEWCNHPNFLYINYS